MGGLKKVFFIKLLNSNLKKDDETLEFLCVEIRKPRVKPFLISKWYRPPNSCMELFDKLYTGNFR
jgi:hypothetical protein